MMRKLLLAAVLGLGLGGCASTWERHAPPPAPLPPPPPPLHMPAPPPPPMDQVMNPKG